MNVVKLSDFKRQKTDINTEPVEVVSAGPSVDERIERIKTSISSINSLMSELRGMKEKEKK